MDNKDDDLKERENNFFDSIMESDMKRLKRDIIIGIIETIIRVIFLIFIIIIIIIVFKDF